MPEDNSVLASLPDNERQALQEHWAQKKQELLENGGLRMHWLERNYQQSKQRSVAVEEPTMPNDEPLEGISEDDLEPEELAEYPPLAPGQSPEDHLTNFINNLPGAQQPNPEPKAKPEPTQAAQQPSQTPQKPDWNALDFVRNFSQQTQSEQPSQPRQSEEPDNQFWNNLGDSVKAPPSAPKENPDRHLNNFVGADPSDRSLSQTLREAAKGYYSNNGIPSQALPKQPTQTPQKQQPKQPQTQAPSKGEGEDEEDLFDNGAYPDAWKSVDEVRREEEARRQKVKQRPLTFAPETPSRIGQLPQPLKPGSASYSKGERLIKHETQVQKIRVGDEEVTQTLDVYRHPRMFG